MNKGTRNMMKPENWDGSRLRTLTQEELCTLLKSRTDTAVRLGNKQCVYANSVVRVVEVLNAMLKCGCYGDFVDSIEIKQ